MADLDEKLKPCPFCGGTFVAQGASRGYISVWCDCGARGPETKFPDDCDPLPPIHDCYAAWNRRAYLDATQAQAPDVVEALRNAIKWIEVEYADARCEPEGEWLAPEARHQHRNLCELLASLSPAKGSEGGSK